MNILEIELKDTPECRFGGKVSDEKWTPVPSLYLLNGPSG